MPSNSPRSSQFPSSSTRVHGDLFADDEAIGDELADGLARIGVGDLVHFVGVEPYLAFAAPDHGGCEAFLRAEVHPEGRERWLAWGSRDVWW